MYFAAYDLIQANRQLPSDFKFARGEVIIRNVDYFIQAHQQICLLIQPGLYIYMHTYWV